MRGEAVAQNFGDAAMQDLAPALEQIFASLHASRPDRRGDRMVGQGRRPGAEADIVVLRLGRPRDKDRVHPRPGACRWHRETAETFRRETENAAWATEAVVAGRALGLTCLWEGDFVEAQASLEDALRLYDPERDREAKLRFGMDSGACVTAYLAHTNWQFGDVERARELIQEAVARAEESTHPPTLAQIYLFKALLEIFRGDAVAARQVAETVVRTRPRAWARHSSGVGNALPSLGIGSATARA